MNPEDIVETSTETTKPSTGDMSVESPSVTEEAPSHRARGTGIAVLEKEVEPEKASTTTVKLEDLQISESTYASMPGVLPHGFFLNGKRLTDFKIRPFDSELDLKLGRLYSSSKVDIKNILVSAFPDMIESIGGHSLEEVARGNSITTQTLIEQMPLGDAISIILEARATYVGTDFSIVDQCDNCKRPMKDNPDEGRFYHNIDDVKIGYIENLEARLVVEIELEEGFVLHGKKCRIVRMRPVRLFELSKMPTMKKGRIDWELVQAQVCEIPECEKLSNVRGMLLNDQAISTMRGPTGISDRALLMKASNLLQKIGPGMSLENNCDNCGNIQDSSLPWGNLRQFLFSPAASD